MAKFKVGDKVVMTDEWMRTTIVPIPSDVTTVYGTVRDNEENFHGDYAVLFDDKRLRSTFFDGTWGVKPKYMRLVASEAPTFKAGDRVRVRRLWLNPPLNGTGVLFDHDTHGLCVRYDDGSGCFDSIEDGATEVIEVLPPANEPSPTPRRTRSPRIERVYPAPRNTTAEEAIVGDDRPAPNGAAFEATMLAHFDDNDVASLTDVATRLATRDANLAIDVGLFAERIKANCEAGEDAA